MASSLHPIVYSPTGDYWYRYDDMQWAPPINEVGEREGDGRVTLFLHEFPVVKYTPKGARISVAGHERWVSRHARKRFACPTKEEALDSFVARKLAQKRILAKQLRRADRALALAQYER